VYGKVSDVPNMDLTNDEREVILKMREKDTLVNGYCEDYPCCGHTPDDPCTREWYDHPDAFNPSVNPHCFCDHADGWCSVEEYEEDVDPDTCEHGDASNMLKGGWRCDLCYSWLVMVTDVSPLAYPSKAVPGLWIEIPVLGIHFEAAA
jgi:hypothetical protein